jgi:hypothetical protein
MLMNRLLRDEFEFINPATTSTRFLRSLSSNDLYEQIPVYSICLMDDPEASPDTIATVEIFAASMDGKKLLYIDDSTNQIGVLSSGCQSKTDEHQTEPTSVNWRFN